MKTGLLLLITLSAAYNCFSQSHETYQGDSIYRVNNIKIRTRFFNWDKAYWRSVDRFGHDGKIYERTEYDSSGIKCMSRSKYEYDSVRHYMKSHIIYNYAHYDTAAKQIVWETSPDTTIAYFEYDLMRRVIKKKLVKTSGEAVSQFDYYYDPFMVVEKFYQKDGGRDETTYYTDKHRNEKKRVNIHYTAGGDSVISTHTYKNVYDKSGKLVRRTIKSEPESEDPRFIDSEEYRYMSNGLLTGKTRYLKNKPGYVIMELYDYKFW